MEDRFKAVIFTDGGFFGDKALPGTDQADFRPPVKAPALFIAGRFDWIFLGKDALLTLLGAPASEKKESHVGHRARCLGAASRSCAGGGRLAG